MELARFDYPSFFNRTLNELQIGQLFEEYKIDPVLNVLLHEAHIDSDAIPGRKREVLEVLVSNLFQEIMHWYTPLVQHNTTALYGESQLTMPYLRWCFDMNNIYLNLSKIFANHQAGQHFVDFARINGFIEPVSMVNYFVENAGLPKIVTQDQKLVVNWSLFHHCAASKSTHISLSGCTMQGGIAQFTHAATIKLLDLEWNGIQVADLAAYTQLTYLDLSHNRLTHVPVNLPGSLKRLYLSGNSIHTLDFKSLPSRLEVLSISYMANMVIPDSFWRLLHRKTITLKVSFDMKVTPPDNYDLSHITFKDQFDRECTLEEGQVVFDLPEEYSTDNTSTDSSRSSDIDVSDDEQAAWA